MGFSEPRFSGVNGTRQPFLPMMTPELPQGGPMRPGDAELAMACVVKNCPDDSTNILAMLGLVTTAGVE